MLCLSQILNVPERNLLVPWNGHFWNVTSIKQTRDAKCLNFATMTNSLSISYGMESVTCPLTDQIPIFLWVFTVIFTWQQSIFICCHMHTLDNNNNSHDNVYGAVIMTSHCESSSSSSDECRLNAGWPPTLRPSQSTWAVSPRKIGSYHPRPSSPLLLLLSP